MKRLSLVFLLLLLLISLFLGLGRWESSRHDPKILRIYNWAHYIPQEIVHTFEAEEGVTVIYDVFDTLETLEAKLLAARSGYDVVFPPAWPTVSLFLPSGAFLKLDLHKLPNRRFLDPVLMARLKGADPLHNHVVPYLWGTTGLIYDRRKVQQLAPEAPRDSLALIFDPQWVQKLSPCHITLLDSPIDVFPSALLFLGQDANNQNPQELHKAVDLVLGVRPWIARFDSSQVMQELISGHVGVAQLFSTYANMAVAKARQRPGGPDLVYVIPKEGALMWVDVMAIPKDAPNQDLAHKFINFMMRPDIMARVTTQIQAANGIPDSAPYMPPEVRHNPGIYPPPDVMAKLHMDRLPTRAYERLRLRLWTQVKTGY